MAKPSSTPPDRSRSAPAPPPPDAWWRRGLEAWRGHPGRAILAGLALVALLALIFADALIAAPMRTWVERKLNSELDGYTVQLARVRPHLWRMAFELEDLVLTQDTHPDPPVGTFAALEFSVDLRALLRFKVVGDLRLERPEIHANLAQLAEEAGSAVGLQDRGWQQAVEAIFPIKLDRVQVEDGSVSYLPGGEGGKPIQLTGIFMVARNVRNVAVDKGTYPSPVSLRAVVFGTGALSFDGAADFLREPHAAGLGELRLAKVSLDRLDPIAREFQVRTRGGLLSVSGSLEYTPEVRSARLTEVLLEDLRLDYVTTRATRAMEEVRFRRALQVAGSVREAPMLFLRVDTLKLTNAQLGFVNDASKPPYRVFAQGVELELENLDNHSGHGRSKFLARGAFMGSGKTVFSGSFLASAKPADFDLRLKVDDTELTDLNPLLLSSTGVDVAQGRLSVYTELAVKEGRIEGYIKPLFKGLKISEHEKDKEKPFLKRVELHLLQFLAFVLKNPTTKEVATVIRVSGSTADPKADEWDVIWRLIGNGFAGAILPTFRDASTSAAPPTPAAAQRP